MSGSASTTPTREVTIDVPTKAARERRPSRSEEEHKSVNFPDGPAIAFTANTVRLYDSSWDEYRELTNAELLEILANIYGVD